MVVVFPAQSPLRMLQLTQTLNTLKTQYGLYQELSVCDVLSLLPVIFGDVVLLYPLAASLLQELTNLSVNQLSQCTFVMIVTNTFTGGLSRIMDTSNSHG